MVTVFTPQEKHTTVQPTSQKHIPDDSANFTQAGLISDATTEREDTGILPSVNTVTISNVSFKPDEEPPTRISSISLSMFEVLFAGIIILLVLVLIGCCSVWSCIFYYKRHKFTALNTKDNQYALPCQFTASDSTHSMLTSANTSYKQSSSINVGLGDCMPTCSYCRNLRRNQWE